MTPIDKRFKLAENATKITMKPKNHNNRKPFVYVTNYNKNNPELFTEIIKKSG